MKQHLHDEKQINNINIFAINTEYEKEEWQKKVRHLMFWYLVECFHLLKQNDFKITLPKELEARRDRYFDDQDHFLQCHKELYHIEENVPKPLNAKNLYNEFCDSQYYRSLPNKQKQQMKYKKYLEELLTRPYFAKIYRERYQNRRCVFKGLTERQLSESEEEDECQIDNDDDSAPDLFSFQSKVFF